MIVALLAFVASIVPVDHHDPSLLGDTFRTAGRVLGAVITRADVQVRGLLVREGMTEETVSRILGSECVIFLAPASFATTDNKPFILFYYIKSGVCVHYRYDERGAVFRVDRVVLPPLSLRSFPSARG